MNIEKLNLQALAARLQAEGPFLTTVDGHLHKVIAAQRMSQGDILDNALVAIQVDPDGNPANNRAVMLDNGMPTRAIRPYQMAVCHRLSINDIIAMVRCVHGQPEWVHLQRCVNWAVTSVWYHGVEPPQDEIEALIHEAYESKELQVLMGHRDSCAYREWYAAGRNPTSFKRYFDMALYAKIVSLHPAEVAA